MKTIAIYGGSFNPIHFGHIGVAKWVKEHTAVDEVWLMVSPNNPLKDKKILAPEEERFEAVKEAVKDIPGLVASDFEFRLPKPSYTADTLRELTIVYPECKFVLIIGEDSLETFHKWKDFEYIVNNFVIFVYPRRGYNKTTDISKYPYMKYLYSAPYFDISSTEIRNNNMNVKELISKARKLRNEAASLETLFHNAAITYLNTVVSVTSCNSDDTDGKACLEEICASYDSDNDLVTIEYTIMNKYGDFVENKTIQVSASEIDKYILK